VQHNQVQVASIESLADAPATAPPTARRMPRLPGADSIWWLVAVAAAFTGIQLIFVRLHGLSWDEVVYVSQVSRHAPAAPFDPARSRGIPLLVAPAALITSSVTVLRVYLALASGGALFGALLAWRRLRPISVLALAGVAFGSLWVAQYYGPQAMPDEWLAFTALAATGLFLRTVTVEEEETTRAKLIRLIGLAALIAAAALIRPGDAVFLVIVLLAGALAVRSWRRWPVIAAIVIGMAAGSAEWIGEAYARFGGPLARLHLASAEQGGFGLRLGIWAELRAVNGPTLCRPCTIAWRYPVLSAWWLALPVLVVLGILVARSRAGRPPRRWWRPGEGWPGKARRGEGWPGKARLGGPRSFAVLAGVCALALASQYLFGIWYAAPRFLLPAYALAAIPVADLIAWIIARTRPAERPAMRVIIGFVLLLQLVSQHAVLMRQVNDTVALHTDYATVAADLRQLGIKTPCLINGAQEIPVAFYTGCASAPYPASKEPAQAASGRWRFALLEWQSSKPPAYARNWTQHRLGGTSILKLIAYLPPDR
jgi:hypothetical protein